jgi:hypothetical protein
MLDIAIMGSSDVSDEVACVVLRFESAKIIYRHSINNLIARIVSFAILVGGTRIISCEQLEALFSFRFAVFTRVSVGYL